MSERDQDVMKFLDPIQGDLLGLQDSSFGVYQKSPEANATSQMSVRIFPLSTTPPPGQKYMKLCPTCNASFPAWVLMSSALSAAMRSMHLLARPLSKSGVAQFLNPRYCPVARSLRRGIQQQRSELIISVT